MSGRVYGGFGEYPLREAVIGAERGTMARAAADLLAEVDELRETLLLFANPTEVGDQRCWCVERPFDDGSTREWRHDQRCQETRELLDE